MTIVNEGKGAATDPSVDAPRAQELRIEVFTTGGTISSTPTGGGGSAPSLSGGAILVGVAADGLSVRVQERPPLPSNWMTIEDAIDLADAIDAAAEDGADAALIVQGTDTLEETGFVVELMRRSSIPVALTGAMRTPATPGADGPANISAALSYLRKASPDTTAVVMNDEAHPARHVRKAHTVRTDAFGSEPFGPLGTVVEGSYLAYRSALPLDRVAVAGLRRTPGRVLVVTGVLGEDFSWLPAVVGRFDGIVVDALGAGHVSRDAARTLELIANRVPVVVTSRTGAAPMPTSTYSYEGSEKFLSEAGALLSGGLDALRARLLLSLVCDPDIERAKAAYRAVESRLVPGLAAHQHPPRAHDRQSDAE